MRIVCISDTHEQHESVQVPEGDVLVFAGDMSHVGKSYAIAAFNEWLGTLPHKHKIVIAGNHDWGFVLFPELSRALITNAIYLEDSGCEIEGVKFWGSPITPEFCGWAFNRRRGEPIRAHWDAIPDDSDVVITHGPPQGILDTTGPCGQPLGCWDLTVALTERVKPKLCVFGHIHGGYGKREWDGTTYVNAAMLDEAYRPGRSPISVDLETL